MAGLAKREFGRDSVKLHMTLINVTNKTDDDDDASSGTAIKGFDARHILDKYADYNFGEQSLVEIHLAIMKSNDTKNGFYKCSSSIQF